MGKFYNENYESVEAFTKEELDAAIAKEATKFQNQLKDKDAEITKVVAERDEKDTKLTKRSEEYNNLKKALEEKETALSTIETDRKATFEKLREDMITKVAGQDKEYADMLRDKFAIVGKETINPTEIETALKDAHALALTAMNRDFTPFSMGGGASGEPPVIKKEGEGVAFTETAEGKATLDLVKSAVGQAAPVIQNDPNRVIY